MGFKMISYEYTGLMIDSKTKTIPYVGKFKSLEELNSWHEKHVRSGKFSSLDLKVSKRMLVNGRPLTIKSPKIFVWINIVLMLVLIAKILLG